jgi:hypothetical protein
MRTEGFVVGFSILFFPLISDACLCKGETSTVAQELAGSRAVFSGKVLYTNRDLQWKRMMILQKFYQIANISPPEFGLRDLRENGVSVTFKVFNSWKGVDDDVLTLITGYGTGDCGIWFKQGDEALVFVNQFSTDWYDVSLCSRTQPLADAAADLAALGPPTVKLTHRSTTFHLINSHFFTLAIVVGVCVLVSGYLGFRKRSKKDRK